MSNVVSLPSLRRAPVDFHRCLCELPEGQRATLGEWLDANADALVDELVRALAPLVQRTRTRLQAIGPVETLRSRHVEVADGCMLDFDERETAITHARLRTRFFDVLAAFTLDERELPRPRLNAESIEQMASRLADAMLDEEKE
jgi:hypothetical protein